MESMHSLEMMAEQAEQIFRMVAILKERITVRMLLFEFVESVRGQAESDGSMILPDGVWESIQDWALRRRFKVRVEAATGGLPAALVLEIEPQNGEQSNPKVG